MPALTPDRPYYAMHGRAYQVKPKMIDDYFRLIEWLLGIPRPEAESQLSQGKILRAKGWRFRQAAAVVLD